MGNKAVNQQKKQMVDLRKAVNAKATTKVVAMIKTFHLTNPELAKEGCQALFYNLSKESEIKRESDLEIFRKGGLPIVLVEIVKNAAKVSEPAGWACGIVIQLSEPATTNRRYENITQELIDCGICEAIHIALNETKDDFLKENGQKAKENLMKISSGQTAFNKLS